MIAYLPPIVNNNPIPMYRDFIARSFKAYGAEVVFDPAVKSYAPVMGIELEQDGKRRLAWYDYSDFKHVNRKLAKSDPPYFKIELRQADVGPGIYPIGQVVPHTIFGCGIKTTPPRQTVRDVYCMMRVTEYENRLNCIRAIRAQKHWTVMAGLTPRPNRPTPPDDVKGLKIDQVDNYHRQHESKICVAAPGIGEKTWRHMETLALGVCLVMPETDCIWPADYTGCVVTCRRDWSDLPEKIDWLLACPGERKQIEQAGLAYWRQWCSPKATARLIVEKTMEERGND